MAINDVMVAVTLACRNQGFELETWRSESEIKAGYDRVTITTTTNKRQQVAVVPDSYFTIIANGRRYPFFLELDRGTMVLKRFGNKVRAYQAYQRSGALEKRYGVRSFRVLTVTLGEKRLVNLKTTTAAAGGGRRFWFVLLADVSADTILTKPVWYSVDADERGALIETKPVIDF